MQELKGQLCQLKSLMMSGSVISQMNLDSFIRDRVQNGYSHATIASELQLIHPGIAGLSRRSVTRHCSLHNIHYASRLPREQLDDLVEQAVSQVSSGCRWCLGATIIFIIFYEAYHKLYCVVC